jgi:hypothetical protein
MPVSFIAGLSNDGICGIGILVDNEIEELMRSGSHEKCAKLGGVRLIGPPFAL